MVQVEERLSSPPSSTRLPTEPAAPSIAIRRYHLLFVGLVILGFLLRIHQLGERAIHHDESLHALYSWYLYVGRGYVHDPMMHGPWQFHFAAFLYFLFGDSDFTARLGNVLFGTAIIAAPFFLRRELGRVGAIVTALLLTISPVFLYFSRFAREDIYFAGWNVLILLGLFGMIRTHRERYLYLAAFGVAGGFATKEAIYISGFIWVSFFALVLVVFRSTDAAALVRSALRAYTPGAYLRAVGLALAVDVLLFTTFFTNMGDPWNCLAGRRCTPGGLWTGTGGALVYWFAQHGVERGGQPWFYYLILLPLYEFVPLLLSLLSLVVLRTRRNLFSWFCLYWAALALVIYSYAGEKMPWITPHIALPMVFLAGQFLGRWLENLSLPRLTQPSSVLVGILGLVGITVLLAALGLNAVESLTPLERQTLALEKVSFVVAIIGLAAGIVWLRRRHRAMVGAPLAVAGLTALTFFYVHTSWMVSYAHGDIPKEMLVYVQSSPDTPRVVKEIERIAFQTGQGKDLKILMDNGYVETVGGQTVVHEAVSWPFEWYLRDYPNRRYFSKTLGPDIQLADYPVALIMAPNLEPVRDRLADYNGQKYRLNWWYPEDYKSLQDNPTVFGVRLRMIPWLRWDTVWSTVTDPTNRSNFLKYLLYRETQNPLGAREFYFFARKEIPPLGPAPSTRGQTMAPVVSTVPRQAVRVERPDGSAIMGRSQDGSPLLVQPKAAAVGPDGRLYVTEGGAHRVTVFGSDGTIQLTWGRSGSGDGEFQEPWGITVTRAGEVFVADTWNHRIQKFDAAGRFLKQWGGLADARGQADERTGEFWGPRDIKEGPDGLLYVTDTGNKRIQVFDAEGRLIRVFGGEGAEPGLFSEPVGLVVDGDSLLVADTWNGRIQRVDLLGTPRESYAVPVWQGESISHKPYITVGPGGRIFVSAPDAGIVQVLGPGGQLGEAVQLEGSGGTARAQPVGLATGTAGELYVVDSRQGVVYRLPASR